MPEFVIRRRFGLELQFDGGRLQKEFLVNCLRQSEPIVLEEEEPIGALNARWVIKPGPAGLELNSPAFEPSMNSVSEVTSVLRRLRFVTTNEQGLPVERFNPITRKCAYHLHLDVSDLSAQELLEILQTAWMVEKAIQSTLPPSRNKDERVKSLRSGFNECPNQTYAIGALEKKSGINFYDYLSRGSMEVTYASGTADPAKVLNWFVLWHCIVERTMQVGPVQEEINDISTLCDWLLFPVDGEEETTLGSTRTFFESRSQKMADQRRRRILEES